MTDPRPFTSDFLPGPGEGEFIPEVLTRDRFRAELLLALAEYRSRLTTPVPLEVAVDHDLDADAEALAGWALEQFDAVARTAVTGLVADEEETAALIELSAAGQAYQASAEFGRYLLGVAEIIGRGLSIKDSTDLARTVTVEAQRLLAQCAELLVEHPALSRLFGEVVAQRSQSLEVHQSVPKDLTSPSA